MSTGFTFSSEIVVYAILFSPWITGFSAILGHSFSPLVNFRGGKGVATAAGVFLALLPKETGIAIAAFALVFAISRIVSLSSIVAVLSLAAATLIMTKDANQSFGTVLVAAF